MPMLLLQTYSQNKFRIALHFVIFYRRIKVVKYINLILLPLAEIVFIIQFHLNSMKNAEV
jgi:hypothetical protein